MVALSCDSLAKVSTIDAVFVCLNSCRERFLHVLVRVAGAIFRMLCAKCQNVSRPSLLSPLSAHFSHWLLRLAEPTLWAAVAYAVAKQLLRLYHLRRIVTVAFFAPCTNILTYLLTCLQLNSTFAQARWQQAFYALLVCTSAVTYR